MHSAMTAGLIALHCLLPAATASDGQRSVFPLEEVSGFIDSAGHTCVCTDQAEPNVAYPPFSSGKPLYGHIRVDMELGNQRSGVPYPFALDESGETGRYDRLYLDLNRNGSLADDKPLTPLPDAPAGAVLTYKGIVQQTCFAYVAFSDGTDATATRAMEFMPRLVIGDSGYATLTFVATKARRGEIQVGPRRYRVVLIQKQPLGTHWDRPEVGVRYEPRDKSGHTPYWLGADRLMGMDEIDGTFWRLSATPEGDRLFVEPYSGDFGTLKIGSGRQFVWRKKLVGSLFARDRAVFAGVQPDRGPEEPVSKCRAPVGDYAPELLNVQFGPLHISLSSNYHADGAPRGKAEMAHPLKICKDETCVLDFSDRAEVLFALPAKNARLAPGDELTVNAVLVDPRLDIMIRDLRRKPSVVSSPHLVAAIGAILLIPVVLWLLGRKAWRQHPLVPVLSIVGLVILAGSMGALYAMNAMVHSREAGLRGYDRLNPYVVVSRADGEVVSEGVMPFG